MPGPPNASPPPAPSLLPQAERRKWVRTPLGLKGQAQLHATAGEGAWPVNVRNISAGGACLTSGRRLDLRGPLTLRVHQAAGDLSFQVPVRVVYAIDPPGADFTLGCAFNRELSPEELKGLL